MLRLKSTGLGEASFMRYMLDTNICIYLIRQNPPQVLQRLSTLRVGDVCMSCVSFAELRAGVEMQTTSKAQDEAALAQLVQRIPALSFEHDAAVQYGVLRAAVRERQRHALDRLIAAHAVASGCTLVTNNTADFKDYPGLALENWV
jgi:tRNA(fMet)-specific endonuclease VapC